jgi:hypothetical protein
MLASILLLAGARRAAHRDNLGSGEDVLQRMR